MKMKKRKIKKKKKDKKNSINDIQSQTNYNENISNIKESNMNNNNNSPSKLFISKKKLKLIIKQSKCLVEGKEYIINSLGLVDSNNKYNDGLTIFGDENVINKLLYNLIFKYRQILEQISFFLKKKVTLIKIMQKSIMIKL